MNLTIDTSTNNVVLELKRKDFVIGRKVWQSSMNQSEELLLEIDLFLKQHDARLKDLTGIAVNPGPGSYTGLRVGVTTANCLAICLNIPITILDNQCSDTRNFSKPILPRYDSEPHITVSKK